MDQRKIISFTVKGKMAFYRKYYSNKNALSYLIPPRTAIIGMIASILELPRNSYYMEFNSKQLNVSLEVSSPLKTLTTSINHLSSRRGNGRRQVAHTLVLPVDNTITYKIYLQFVSSNKYEDLLIKKLSVNDMGFGIYLGQRQFLASIIDFKIIEDYKNHSKINCCLNSIVNKNNVESIENITDNIIVKDLMPLDFVKTKNNREGLEFGEVIYEQNGQAISGEFRNIVEFDDKYISFYN